MKDKIEFIPRILLSVFILSFLTICCLSVYAQNNADAEKNKLLSPAKEKFTEANALVAPWRISGCHDYYMIKLPDCYTVSSAEGRSSDVVNIYNEDGSLWYRFSNQHSHPDYFGNNKTMNFLPFATYPAIGDVILRMVGESPNWYEVEVNEETQTTKFILKSDPLWAKRTWDYWLTVMQGFKLDDNQLQLLDKPNGQVIKESSEFKFIRVDFLKTDGDWAFVRGSQDLKNYEGWIRWREGRKLLFKPANFLFNFAKIRTDTENK